MDATALFNLSYGMYVISSKDGDRNIGCVANSATQISSSPATLAISLNKLNYTTACVQKSGLFTLSILSEKARAELIGTFGFNSGKETDKFDGIDFITAESGLAVPKEGICAYLDCRVINQTDCYTHTVFFAEIADARNLAAETPMTYAYYHRVIKGKAPKNAPTYIPEAAEATKHYVCDVCGYVFEGTTEEFEALPEDYACPICTAPKSCFVLK